MDRVNRKMLVESLCKYFRLDYEEIEAIDEIKMLYVHDKIFETTGKDDMKDILEEVAELGIRIRNRRRNLNEIYYHLKMESMNNSGRYDTSTKKPPIRVSHYDNY